jgi:hypothetical protein
MVRSIWKGTLVTTFAWAGLAWAQPPITSAMPCESAGQAFTVQEAGKASQKCKVLKTWKTPEGKAAYQVQAADTGEMMTIVATGEATSQSVYQAGKRLAVQAVASRIFRWSSDGKPLPGTPMPPIETVQTLPRAAPRPEVAKMATAAHPQPAKPTASAQSEPTKPPVAALTKSTKSTITFPWFSRANDTRGIGQFVEGQPLAADLLIPLPLSAQSEPTRPPAAALTKSTKSTFTFPWFSRANDTRALGGLEGAVTLAKPTPLAR